MFGGYCSESNNKQGIKDDFWKFQFTICKYSGNCVGLWTHIDSLSNKLGLTACSASIYKNKYLIITGGEKLDYENME